MVMLNKGHACRPVELSCDSFPGDIEVPAVLRNRSGIAIRISDEYLANHRNGFVRVDVRPMINPVDHINHLGFWDIGLDYFLKSNRLLWATEGLQTDHSDPLPGCVFGNLKQSANCELHISVWQTSLFSKKMIGVSTIQAFYLHNDKLPLLRNIWMPITGRCNLACVMCGRTKRDEIPLMRVFFRNADVSKTIVDAVKGHVETLQAVGFIGFGEPFVNEHVFEILEQFRALLPNYATLGLSSNATVLDNRICLKIIESRLDFLTFSIDGATKATYEKIRVHGDFDQVIENIKRLVDFKSKLKADKPFLKACFVIMEANYHEVVDFVRLAQRLGIAEVIYWLENETGITLPRREVESLLEQAVVIGNDIGVNVNRHACVFPEVVPDHASYVDHVNHHRKSVERLLEGAPDFCPDGANDLDYIDDNFGKPDYKRPDLYCPYMETMIIEHSGDINPCCTYWNEYTLRLPQRFGNVNKQSVADIWNSRTYASFRKRVIEQNWPVICQNCNARLPRHK